MEIVQQIRAKLQHLAKLEAEASTIRRELAEIRKEVMGQGSQVIESVAAVTGSSTDMAENVLRKVGRPMHVSELLAAIETEYHITVKGPTLVGNLARLVKRKKTFRRVGPNIFGLIDSDPISDQEIGEMFGEPPTERQDRRM